MEKLTFEGWSDCVRLSNKDVELVATTTFGPRIIRYGFHDGPNAFHVIPETRGQTGGGAWLPYGGHRLWHAPEVLPRSYGPDSEPVGTVEMDGDTLRLANPPEPLAGVAKEVRVTLASKGSGVRVEHVLTNHNPWPITLAAWGLSIVANGGQVVFPQEPFVSHDNDLTPARPVVIWKFTDMADSRWRWGTRYLTLSQTGEAGNPQKVGIFNARGWAAHISNQQAFIIRIDVAPGGPSALPDQGCNFETYTDGPFQELETLGPLVLLDPDQSVSHTEFWHLGKVSGSVGSDDDLDSTLLPLVKTAQRETSAAFG